MMILLVATLGLIAAAILALWPAPGDRAHRAPAAAIAEPAETARPTCLEGVLAAQLVGGDISRPQYLRAIERLAARDEERHPLAVPWDDRRA
ncbi:hypothetical protein [Actinoplanes flavus]|uniref:C-type cytochrome biogenesis protein CcmI n=1 Tax=Actinoplanes flavus TaxID=2820290 RepID=A0ABS3UJK3_9ACTN|nr:hypothetical protein [Actinoplanes flavus]MBO3738921.1 hypothetical protein [Actinoplanes flavus]